MRQNRRNAATLEATTARNEWGQVFTLAELVEKSPANKRIRRGELMTRIAGWPRSICSAPIGQPTSKFVESVRHVWSIERPQVQARRFD